MRHVVGAGGPVIPQTLSGARTYPSASTSKKTAKLFETIESSQKNSVSQQQLKQAVSTVNPQEVVTSLEAKPIVEQSDELGASVMSGRDLAKGGNGLNTSLNNTESPDGTAGQATRVSTNPQLKSLASVGNQLMTNADPGSVVNVLI